MYKQHGISSVHLQPQRAAVVAGPDGGNARVYALLADGLALGKMLSFAMFVLFSVLPDGAVECSGLGIEMVVQDSSARLLGTSPWVTQADVRRSCAPSVPAAGILRRAFVGCMVLNSGLFLSCMLLRYKIQSGGMARVVKDATVAAMWLGGCFASWSKMAIAISFTDLSVHFSGEHADGYAYLPVSSDLGTCSFVTVPSTGYVHQNNDSSTATCPLQLDCRARCTLAPNSVEIVSSSTVFILSLSYFSYMAFELWKSMPTHASAALAAARNRMARHTNALFFTIADLSNLLKFCVTALNMALILNPQTLVVCGDLAGAHHPTIKARDIRQACSPTMEVDSLEASLLFAVVLLGVVFAVIAIINFSKRLEVVSRLLGDAADDDDAGKGGALQRLFSAVRGFLHSHLADARKESLALGGLLMAIVVGCGVVASVSARAVDSPVLFMPSDRPHGDVTTVDEAGCHFLRDGTRVCAELALNMTISLQTGTAVVDACPADPADSSLFAAPFGNDGPGGNGTVPIAVSCQQRCVNNLRSESLKGPVELLLSFVLGVAYFAVQAYSVRVSGLSGDDLNTAENHPFIDSIKLPLSCIGACFRKCLGRGGDSAMAGGSNELTVMAGGSDDLERPLMSADGGGTLPHGTADSSLQYDEEYTSYQAPPPVLAQQKTLRSGNIDKYVAGATLVEGANKGWVVQKVSADQGDSGPGLVVLTLGEAEPAAAPDTTELIQLKPTEVRTRNTAKYHVGQMLDDGRKVVKITADTGRDGPGALLTVG
jgi:hypothetical protein